MPRIQRPNIGPVSVGPQISGAGSVTATNAAIGDLQEKTGLAIQQAGQNVLDQTVGAFKTAELNKNLGNATVSFNEQFTERARKTVDKKGNPTFKTLVNDTGAIGDDIIKEFSKGIVNPDILSKFTENMKNHIQNKQILALSQARTQQMEFATTALSTSLDQMKEQALEDDPSNLGNYTSSANEMIDLSLQNGIVSPQQAQALKGSFNSEVRKVQITKAIQADPASVIRELQKPASELGLKETERLQLQQTAVAQLNDQTRLTEKNQREAASVAAQQQSLQEGELSLGIIKGSVGEHAILTSFNDGEINAKQKITLQKQLARADNTARKASDTNNEITNAIAAGQPLTLFSGKDIDTHFGAQIATLQAANPDQPITLTQKANLASSYMGTVPSFNKELEYAAKFGSGVEALRATEFMLAKDPEGLQSMDSDTRQIMAMASTLSLNTNISDEDALKRAREVVLNKDDEVLRANKNTFNTMEKFKPENLSSTINDMMGLTNIFGFGGETISPQVQNVFRKIVRNNFEILGDQDAAEKATIMEIKPFYGATKFNQHQKATRKSGSFMFLPPEKVFPDTDHRVMDQNLQEAATPFLPEGVGFDQVSIESDELTRLNTDQVSYGMTVPNPNDPSTQIPLVDENGIVKRWAPTQAEMREGQAKLDQANQFFDTASVLELVTAGTLMEEGTSREKAAEAIVSARGEEPTEKSQKEITADARTSRAEGAGLSRLTAKLGLQTQPGQIPNFLPRGSTDNLSINDELSGPEFQQPINTTSQAATKESLSAGSVKGRVSRGTPVLGDVSSKYESGGKGPGVISTGQDDPGGKSYGSYQLAMNTGTLDGFLRNSAFAEQFAELIPGTKAFDKRWKEIAKSHPEDFEVDQRRYLLDTHFNPVRNQAKGLGYPDTPAINELLFSMAIQHGGTPKLISQLSQEIDLSASSERDIVKKLFKLRRQYVRGLDLAGGVIDSLIGRYTKEEPDILKLIAR